jgi:uncharacterized protein (DUF427 family)
MSGESRVSRTSARIDGELHSDVAWTFRFTIPQLPRIAGLLAFRDELVRELPGD